MPPRKRKKKAAAAKKEEGEEEQVEAEAEAEEPAAKKQETEAGEEPALVHVVSSSEPAPAPAAPPLDAEVASLLASAREAVAAPQPSVAAAALSGAMTTVPHWDCLMLRYSGRMGRGPVSSTTPATPMSSPSSVVYQKGICLSAVTSESLCPGLNYFGQV